MSRLILVTRLAARDLRYRPAQALLLLLAITAATTVLTLGLALHGVTSHPYQQTRAATNGPDAVAQVTVSYPGERYPGPPALAEKLTHAPGVTAASGPFPETTVYLRARGLLAGAVVEGRSQAPSRVDQPKLTSGSWVRPGGVVLERTFAEALGVVPGDRITLSGRTFTVAGTAVTAASTPFPNLCETGCALDFSNGVITPRQVGLVWATEPDTRAVVPASSNMAIYAVNLKLRDPAQATAFAKAHTTNLAPRSAGPGAGSYTPPPVSAAVTSWQAYATAAGQLVADEQQVLSPGAFLAALLAIASVAVLAGGRMAEQTRRTGLIKAVGGTPGVVAAVLLAEYVFLALVSAVVGLAIGRLAAPLITNPGAGLVGSPGAPSLTGHTVAEVVVVALVVALAATLVPTIRAARTSTIRTLAGTARSPRRRPRLIALSARLPVPLLLGLRLVARRPRRALLSAASVAITSMGVVAVLTFQATAGGASITHGLGNPVLDRDDQMLTVLTVVLIALAVLNAVCSAWATVLDSRTASALARALGATPRQVGAGIAAAQLIPALPGALLGIPLGIALFMAAGNGGKMTVPATWWLALAVLGTLAAVGLLASIPARIGARRPVAPVLQAETA